MNGSAPNVRELLTSVVALRDDLAFTPDISREPAGYTIEDRLRGKYYRVGIAEYTFLSLLDGQTSIAKALGAAAGKLGPRALAEHEVLALCRWALDCQLAYPVESDQAARLGEVALKNDGRRLFSILNPLSIQLPLIRPDRMLTGLSRRLGWVFSPWFFAVWSLLVLYAVYLVAVGWSHLTRMAMVILDRDNWLRLVVAWLLLKMLHELAHGLACKKFGGSVPVAGITILFFFPLAYVDVTSSWRFRSKWQRVVTAAAGMYAELLVAALAVIVWSSTTPGLLHHMALNLAVTAGFTTLMFNGNPLVRFDGYFIASDLFDVPNLYSCSQQSIVDGIHKYLLGCETPAPSWPTNRGWLIRLYAPAALVWRVLFFLTLALALVGRFSYLGGAMAAGLLGLGWGVPLFHTVRRTARTVPYQRVNRRRITVTAAVTAIVIAGGTLLATRPGRVEAPAVVDYAPLTVIRAATPGFVREIKVVSGQEVKAGQVIAVLQNKELAAELSDLELALEQSVIRGRMNRQNDEMAKQQVEIAQQEALNKKIGEASKRIEGLVIRAPADGRVVAQDLDSLSGRYLQEGDQVALLGQEDCKEVVIAVSQDDAHLFCAHAHVGDVTVRDKSGLVLQGHFAKVEPRGSTELPHPALAASTGGPLPVRPRPQSDKPPTPANQSYELLSPVFIGKATFSPEQSVQVRAGQLTTISFHTASESAASRWGKSALAWLTKYQSGRSGQ